MIRLLLCCLALPWTLHSAEAGLLHIHLAAGGAMVSNQDIGSYADLSPLGYEKTGVDPGLCLVGGIGFGFGKAEGFYHEVGYERGPQRELKQDLWKNGVLVSNISSTWNSSDFYYLAGNSGSLGGGLSYLAGLKFSAELFNGKHEETNLSVGGQGAYDMGAAGFGLTPLARLDLHPAGAAGPSLGLELGYAFVSMGQIATRNMSGVYSALKHNFNQNPDGSTLAPDTSGPFMKMTLGWAFKRPGS